MSLPSPNVSEEADWVFAQLGAREHYVLPAELQRRGRLRALLTDAWVPPQHPLHAVPGSLLQPLAERHNAALLDAPVYADTTGLLVHEAYARIQRWSGWERIMKRNEWFEQHVVRAARSNRLLETTPSLVVFAYSYAAHDLFVEAKKHGATCILGQIDAGPHEEDLVAQEHERYPAYDSTQVRAPQAYWDRWRAECDLADTIIVNSDWSQHALRTAGIDHPDIRTVPLAYPGLASAAAPQQHTYPDAFTEDRPLRVLYLGTLTLRKGLARVVDAAALVEDAPIEFHVVGDGSLSLPEAATDAPNIHWLGRVPRGEVDRYYRRADLFLFPTLSDGFGLTQLEAQAVGLPILASERCGDVVEDGVNGLRVPEPTPDAIAGALRNVLDTPGRLQAMSNESPLQPERFSPHNVVNLLEDAACEPTRSHE